MTPANPGDLLLQYGKMSVDDSDYTVCLYITAYSYVTAYSYITAYSYVTVYSCELYRKYRNYK